MSNSILIVGAGPTGLTLGIELLRRGVPCRIIDKAAGPAATSRSFTLHARTLELFEMAGFADRFLERGIRSVSMDYSFRGVAEVARLDFTELDSRHAYILVISQNVTERILRDRFTELGGDIEWDTELQALTGGSGTPVTATVTTPNGNQKRIRAGWVVGCDGLRSTVRTHLGLDFTGDDYDGVEMRMMDVPLSGKTPATDRVHYMIDQDRMVLVTKLPEDTWRILISDPGANDNAMATRESFQTVIDDHFAGAVTLGNPEWISTFRVWRRLSAGYGHHGIYLCGDAAHIHSPAGGQGMNACIQDAVNLGWKLALVARHGASLELLDSYERERRPIAEQVIAGTHLLHRVIMAHGTSLTDRLAITREPGFNTRAIRQISGLAYTYRDTIDVESEPSPVDELASGDRAPDATVTPSLRVHDLLRHPDHTLLVLQRRREPLVDHRVDTLPTHLRRRYGDRVRTAVIATKDLTTPSPGTFTATDTTAHDLYGTATGDGLALIRPDGYIALRCAITDEKALTGYLDTTLT
ncbi:FAD-dependent monooxygenase [Nocardia sp. CNY236]|uniref:FAD-dependent monooxygenase n=1 Tax=Nocardia sp. CNY236 TaxID=1169152 RepID=UPI0003FE4888|nr:FAD-dependent monooxygenase [Nocardia sp. CNY236]